MCLDSLLKVNLENKLFLSKNVNNYLRARLQGYRVLPQIPGKSVPIEFHFFLSDSLSCGVLYTNKQTNKQTNKLTNKQINKTTDKQKLSFVYTALEG